MVASLTARTRFAQRRNTRLVLGSVALLAIAWIAAPAQSTPPLYDGIGFPDEPYLYVVAPVGTKPTPRPTSAIGTGKLTDGRSPILNPLSDEQGPQVQLMFDEGDFMLPAGQSTFTVRADPLAPTKQPSNGTIWGNVYRVSATSPGGPATLNGQGTLRTITLRAPSADLVPMIEADTGHGWQPLKTTRQGNDLYSAPIPALGDYAVVTPDHSGTTPTTLTKQQPSGIDPLVWILGGTVMLLAGVSIAVRTARSSERRP
jgi:hypothetical protein